MQMEEISGGGGSESTVSKEETVEQNENFVSKAMIMEGCDDSELELGLGLSLGNKTNNNKSSHAVVVVPRILTAKDLPSPSSASSCSSLGLKTPASTTTNNSTINSNVTNSSNVTTNGNGNGKPNAGTKRAASPTGVSQVVGWPPIRAYRMNSMANQAKSIATEDRSSQFEEKKQKEVIYGSEEKCNSNPKDRAPIKSSLFVKVNMDGVAIGRKVDLNTHSSYESLAQTLEDMFTNRASEKCGSELDLMPKVTRPSKLLDGSSEFVLTYEDKDGDWMLVGDVPWGMFTSSVKRLKIMRTSEANGLAPRLEERCAKQRCRPI